MNIGDRVKRESQTLQNDRENGKRKKDGAVLKGTVVYIHPQKRYYTVKFDCGWCECFNEGLR